MKKFTLIACVSLLAGQAIATPVNGEAGNAFFPLKSQKTELAERQALSHVAGYQIDSHRLEAVRDNFKSGRRVMPSTRADQAPAGKDDIVYNAPDGIVSLQARNSIGYLSFWGMIIGQRNYGVAIDFVEGEDGFVYMNHPFSEFDAENWLKGTKDPETGNITFMAQPVYCAEDWMYDEETDEYVSYDLVGYAVPMEYRIVDEEEQAGWCFPTADLKMTFIYDAATGTYSQENPELILGLCTWDLGYIDEAAMETYDYQWVGYGDSEMTLRPVTDTLLEAPASLEALDWTYLQDSAGHYVSVGFDGDECYMKGIFSNLPNAWVKGAVEGDKITFPRDQYLGVDDAYGRVSYFVPADYVFTLYEDAWDEFDGYWEYVPVSGDIVFEYDADAKRISYDKSLGLAGEAGVEDSLYAGVTAPEFFYNPHVEGAAPSTPVITSVTDFDLEWGFGTFMFDLSQLDVNGALLDGGNLFYEVYFDGELFTFDPEDYFLLEEPMTLVPYYFNDMLSIIGEGLFHMIYFYVDGLDTIGVRAVYYEADGTLSYSDMDVYALTGVEINKESAEVKNVRYYDLQGREIKESVNGLRIVKKELSDGSVKVSKEIR